MQIWRFQTLSICPPWSIFKALFLTQSQKRIGAIWCPKIVSNEGTVPSKVEERWTSLRLLNPRVLNFECNFGNTDIFAETISSCALLLLFTLLPQCSPSSPLLSTILSCVFFPMPSRSRVFYFCRAMPLGCLSLHLSSLLLLMTMPLLLFIFKTFLVWICCILICNWCPFAFNFDGFHDYADLAKLNVES